MNDNNLNKEIKDKKNLITEKYSINGREYTIKYSEETKALDLFNCLNRMLVQRDGWVIYKDISIQSMPSMICIE